MSIVKESCGIMMDGFSVHASQTATGIWIVLRVILVRTRVRVSYTWKINHFAIFFLPILRDIVFTYEKSPATKVLGLIIAISMLAIFLQPLRDRNGIICTWFPCFDRPERRHHTLRWLASQ